MGCGGGEMYTNEDRRSIDCIITAIASGKTGPGRGFLFGRGH